MKPHIRRGRFFNHEREKARDKIFDVFRVVGYVMRHKLSGRRPFLVDGHDPQAWVVPYAGRRQGSGIASVTWLGHATFLLEMGGLTILTDPIFGGMGPYLSRQLPLLLDLGELVGKVDVILISHNHKDHVDVKSLKRFLVKQPKVFVPRGDERLMRSLGFANVTGFDWWQAETVVSAEGGEGGVNVTFLPANHWSGRNFFDTNRSLWGSWLIQHQGFSLYCAGDSAAGQHFELIGKKFPGINVALMPIGPEEPRHLMKDTHLSSQEAVEAFISLGARHFIPMHWGTFKFGVDTFGLPLQRLLSHWERQIVARPDLFLHLVKVGQTKEFEI